MKNTRSVLIIILIIVVGLFAGAAISFLFLSSQNAATDEALTALESNNEVIVEQMDGEDWWIFRPANSEPDTGFIIYPGGLVDPLAYAPIANAIAAEGFLVILDPMPLDLAVIDSDSASEIILAFPEIESWAIGGHSLGGAMAADFAANEPDMVDGLALWAAYPAGGTDLSGLPIQVVSVYGDADCVATVEEVTSVAPFLPPDTEFVLIEGGNHTQFGSYGEGLQRGDCAATVSREDQQQQVVDATVMMLQSISQTPQTKRAHPSRAKGACHEVFSPGRSCILSFDELCPANDRARRRYLSIRQGRQSIHRWLRWSPCRQCWSWSPGDCRRHQ